MPFPKGYQTSGGKKHPLVGEKFAKKAKHYAYDSYAVIPKFYWLTFKAISKGFGGPRKLSRNLFLTKGKREKYFEHILRISNIFP